MRKPPPPLPAWWKLLAATWGLLVLVFAAGLGFYMLGEFHPLLFALFGDIVALCSPVTLILLLVFLGIAWFTGM